MVVEAVDKNLLYSLLVYYIYKLLLHILKHPIYRYNINYPNILKNQILIRLILRGCSVANRLHIHNVSIRAPFSVTRFVISGGYHLNM